MKKLLWILVMGLLWCNSSNALILNNCFTIESSDPENPIYTKFHKDSWDADSWKIYFEQKIVTNVTVFSDKGYKKKKELIEYINKNNVGRDGFPMEPPDRIITRTYTMTFGDESVVTTEDRKITSHGDLKKTNVAIDLIKSIVYFKHVYKGQSSSFDPIFINHTYQCDKPEGSEN